MCHFSLHFLGCKLGFAVPEATWGCWKGGLKVNGSCDRPFTRILHTSDWHLGLQTGTVSRLPDQEAFLKWLTELLAEEEVDALVVAGDIFDSMQPSAEALSAYYRFLAGLPGTGVRDVVVVGGNHDSPSRLEAPKDVLAALNVRVVGTIGRAEDRLDHLVVPLRRRGREDPSVVCLAVPFVHEYRLGVRTTDSDAGRVRKAFAKRFEDLYGGLVDLAEGMFPGRPVIATGHLTVGAVKGDDYRDPIHQVGFIGALPPSVLDRRIAYGALGHIHRAFPVADGRVWYSGSPYQISVSDDARHRKVIRVDVPEDGGAVRVTPLPVPVFRELCFVEGTPEEVIQTLRSLRSQGQFPPLVHVRVWLKGPFPGLRDRLIQAAAGALGDRRPFLVDIRECFVGAREESSDASLQPLQELTEGDVFARLCQIRGEVSTEELERAFQEIASLSDEDLEKLLHGVENAPMEVP